MHIGCPTVHARRQLGRLHLHARQLARVAHIVGKPLEHAPARTVKDIVEPCLGLATCCTVQGLGHRTRAELSNARQRSVELLLNLPVPILELLDDGRGRAARVAHLNIDLLGPQKVLALAVRELLAKGVERVDVILGDARLVGDVQEAPAQLVVDACVDGNLLPQLERLQAVTQHRATLKLHRAGSAVDRVHQLACIEVVIAVGRREPSTAKEVTVGTPQHDRIVRDWVPLNLRVVEPTRKHEAEAHEGVEQRVGPQSRAALNHPLVHDRVLNGRSPAQVHERQLLGARVSVVRPHHLLGQSRALVDCPVHGRCDAYMRLHHLGILARQAANTSAVSRQECQIRVGIRQTSSSVTSARHVDACACLRCRHRNHTVSQYRLYHVVPLFVVATALPM